ncbi:MAG TPA: IPT/TIG domain-containing protein, partial [Gammaproteobacteria bacterium]
MVTESGRPLNGFVSAQVNNQGTRLSFRPSVAFTGGREYRVTLSGALADLHGETLGDDYSFRFVASDARSPQIDSIEPRYGSWRGGELVTVRGANFTAATQISVGGVPIPAGAQVRLLDDEIAFYMPPLERAPARNRPVGIELSNGELRSFVAAGFTYVADPTIAAIGAYEPLTNDYNPAVQRFLFNAGEYAAIEGEGLNAFTRVRINGRTVEETQLVDSGRLSFRIPDNTLGPLTVSVSNLDSRIDEVSSTALNVELEAALQLRAQNDLRTSEVLLTSARAGDLLMIAARRTVNNVDSYLARLYSTRDSALPVYLATLELPEAPTALTLSERYAMFRVGARQELLSYDIGNVYAPAPLGRIANPGAVAHDKLRIAGETFVSQGADGIHVGYVQGGEWQTHALQAIDLAADRQYLYVLTATDLEVRALHAADTLIASIPHVLINPLAVSLAPQRLLLHGSDEVQLIDLSRLATEGVLSDFGRAALPELTHAAIAGELLAAVSDVAGVRTLRIYDMDRPTGFDTALTLTTLADVRTGQMPGAADELRFAGEQVEWQDSQAYYNTTVPIPNILTLQPTEIGDDSEPVALKTAGPVEAWRSVILQTTRASDTHLLSGTTQLLGDQVRFVPIGDRFELGETYSVDLFNTPAAVVNGAEPQFDMPWRVGSATLFGITPIEVVGLVPGNSIGGLAMTYTVHGHQLQNVTTLRLNAVAIPVWTVSEDGTTLTFDAVLPQPGLYSLHAGQPGQEVTLPAALVVAEALAVNSVVTDHAQGANRVSDSGGTAVTLTGSGFQGELSVHWFEADAGILPSEANRIAHTRTAAGLLVQSPTAEPGIAYRIVVRKPHTGEEVWAATQLSAVDDTRPSLQQSQTLGYTAPVLLIFNEAMQAAGFSVSAVPFDYSGSAAQDISARFDLLVRDNSVELRLRAGQALDHNHRYDVTITGISDTHANPPTNTSVLNAGVYSASFMASDNLAPRQIQLLRAGDAAPVTPAISLTRGRTYSFTASAVDNISSSTQFEVRISTDGGLSFAAPQALQQGTFSLPVRAGDGGSLNRIAFRVTARDTAGNRAEQRFEAAVADPVIDVGALYTDPAAVEEIKRANILFDLNGDVDLISGAEMRVLDRWYPVTVEQLPGDTARVALGYLNPRLADVPGTAAADGSKQIPVRLQLEYGFGSTRTVDDAYTLVRDATPPSLSIASPGDGDRIVLNEVTDVILQSFDEYGIERVEVRVNGAPAWTELSNPNRYSFTATTLDPVTIEARATDSNGNVSTIAAVQLQPYDAAAGEPQLDIVAPANGSQFHEGENVSFELVLRNLDQADLYFDVGGIESATPAASIMRGADDPERFAYAAALPAVDMDTVVVVRVQNGALRARRFLNVLNDTGIDQEPELRLVPASEVLGGTQLAIQSSVPDGMDDFSDASEIRIQDPAPGAVTGVLPMAEGAAQLVNLGADGTAVRVDAILRDRSQNERTATTNLLKQPYFATDTTPLYTTGSADEMIGPMVSVPGLKTAGDDLVWAVNRRSGGYELRDADGVIGSAAEGQIERLVFSGSALIAQISRAGNRELAVHALQMGDLSAPVLRPLAGEL